MNISTIASIAILGGVGLNAIQKLLKQKQKQNQLTPAQKKAKELGLPIESPSSGKEIPTLTQKQSDLVNETNFSNLMMFESILYAYSPDPETAIMKNISGEQQLNEFVLSNSDKVIMLLFSTLPCPACKNIVKDLVNPNTVKLFQKTMPKLLIAHIDLFFAYNKNIVSINQNSGAQFIINGTPSYVFVKISNGEIIQFSDIIIPDNRWIKSNDIAPIKKLYDSYLKNK